MSIQNTQDDERIAPQKNWHRTPVLSTQPARNDERFTNTEGPAELLKTVWDFFCKVLGDEFEGCFERLVSEFLRRTLSMTGLEDFEKL